MKIHKGEEDLKKNLQQLLVHNSTTKTALPCEVSPYFCEVMTNDKKKQETFPALNLKAAAWSRSGRSQWIRMDQSTSGESAERILAETKIENTQGSSTQRRPNGSLRERPFQFEPFAVACWCWHPDRVSLPHTFLSH